MSGSQTSARASQGVETPEQSVNHRAMQIRVGALERELAENTEATLYLKLQSEELRRQLAALVCNTKEILDVFNSWKGAFKVIESLGKIAKPLGYITGFLAAVAAFVHWGPPR